MLYSFTRNVRRGFLPSLSSSSARYFAFFAALGLASIVVYSFGLMLVYLAPLRSHALKTIVPLRDDELPRNRSSWAVDSPERGSYPIPAILHQVSIYDDPKHSIPEAWSPAVISCKALHPDYQYMLWNKSNSRGFLKKNFAWFLPTWDAYAENIYRADAIRYFALYAYGGIYLDLDVGCNRRIDFLRRFPAVFPETIPIGYSNSMMMTQPKHPLFLQMIHELPRWRLHLPVRYANVMFSAGPMFLSCQIAVYRELWDTLEHLRKSASLTGSYESDKLPFRAISRPMFETDTSVAIFDNYEGNSWHTNDAPLVLWLGGHLHFLSRLAFLVVIFVSVFGMVFLCGHRGRVLEASRLN
mmetsp:Transcript_9683/g.19763  ORF Transcript_9683/g.19763 Transcript_9683/m.19763 type:complete len:355 (+) Transcript_9683:71-1135(+)